MDMRHTNQTDGWERGSGTSDSSTIPFDGGYLTDGETLFHIERTLVNDPGRGLLVELEDCVTLELIVCSARSVAELGLRPVQPRLQTTS